MADQDNSNAAQALDALNGAYEEKMQELRKLQDRIKMGEMKMDSQKRYLGKDADNPQALIDKFQSDNARVDSMNADELTAHKVAEQKAQEASALLYKQQEVQDLRNQADDLKAEMKQMAEQKKELKAQISGQEEKKSVSVKESSPGLMERMKNAGQKIINRVRN